MPKLTMHNTTSRYIKLLFASLIMATSLNGQAQSEPFKASEADFNAWLSDFKKQAHNEGISQSTLDQAFKNVKLNAKVLESDKKQPEFTKTFFDYFNRAVSESRVENGLKNYEANKPLLDEVTKKYGVPGRFLVAFWGLETNYGSYTGNLPIIESLATLAYDPRRSKFFSTQLMSALTILDRGHVSLEQMKGSWAGAMGQCQFMPSNYLQYAVDGDGDGKINLWDSLPDVFYSAGNFLNQLGWQAQENWGREVALPKDFDYALADNKTARPLNDWKKLGITLADGREIPNEDMQAKLLLASDYQGPAFLVYDNFKVIKRWNNADKYALSVGHLADRIVKLPPLSKQKPKDDKGMSYAQIKEIQSLLNEMGYNVGKPDGIAGSKTRNALRDFQAKHKLPADGFASVKMLEKLQQVQTESK
ncbi:lytic murein transglycosylase [Thiomicrorhabdus sp. Kp2]|uniref:lytic murein transglycosylase n=1 Tax=Thiomicrorhabdus sp. Kp2 TaxID=1123518 RepID=UPI00041C6305|nr:lytic murein transglycosylase [Thiomicrorhabdus sp. Kp2]